MTAIVIYVATKCNYFLCLNRTKKLQFMNIQKKLEEEDLKKDNFILREYFMISLRIIDINYSEKELNTIFQKRNSPTDSCSHRLKPLYTEYSFLSINQSLSLYKNRKENIMESHNRGLYRSSNQAVIGGVAAGIAEHLKTDPTLVRIIFAIIAFFGGGGILIYVILWIALPTHETSHFEIPKEPVMESEKKTLDPDDPNFAKPVGTNNGGLIAGLIMISLGLIFLADRFLPRIHFHDLWPIVLLVVGIVLIKSAYSKPKS